MSKIIYIFVCLLFSGAVIAQAPAERVPVLYGICTQENLAASPYSTWFTKSYDAYTPNEEVLRLLKKENFKDVSIKVFFGTWCGDSKREMPHFLKIMNDISFPASKITMIAVGNSDSLYKQSPQHEEANLSIFRVPTFIFFRNGKEINRIVEFPVNSLEKDVLAILDNKNYTPNYPSFMMVTNWLSNGVFADTNITIHSLAAQIKPTVVSEFELNSIGYILMAQHKTKEAINVFRVNAYLYPQSSNVASSLGEGYLDNGDTSNAIFYLEQSLGLNKEPKAVKSILDLLYKAKGLDTQK